MSNTFCEYFTNVASTLKQKSSILTNLCWRLPATTKSKTNVKFEFQQVPKQIIEKLLKNLKRNKSTGLDGLTPSLLKDSAKSLAQPLTFIINLSLTSGIVPSIWKSAKITPIHKSGATNVPDNYRPISILPALSKIMEKVVYTQLIDHLENSNALNSSQFGFRSKRSTKLATTLFVDDIRRNIDSSKLVGAVFIDLTKAFDTVGHSVLLSKLSAYGVFDVEHKWFTDYLFNRKQLVNLDNTLSEAMSVKHGVPQGSILGPLLFIIFFNDLAEVLKHSKVVKFADDTVIYYGDKDFEVIENKLNTDLQIVIKFFEENELLPNLKVGKTECMLFGTAKRLSKVDRPLEAVLRGTVINFVEKYKYLGTFVDKNLNFISNFENSYKRASSRLRLLEKVRPYLNKSARRKVYEMMILPILTYSSLVDLSLTQTQSKKYKSIERRAMTVVGDGKNLNIENMIRKESCLGVRKCLENKTCSNFQQYFAMNRHCKSTRNQNVLVRLPRVKLEIARKGYFYLGAKMYNELPLEIRKAEDFNTFRHLLNEHLR